MLIKTKFDIGDTLKDRVTGFIGVALCASQYATGCIHYALQMKKLKDGVPAKWQYFDETQLEKTNAKKIIFPALGNGGPVPNPPQM